MLENVISLQASYASLSGKVSLETQQLINELKETRGLLQKIDSYVKILKDLKELRSSKLQLKRQKDSWEEIGNMGASFGQENVAAAGFQNSERNQQEINKLESQLKDLQIQIDQKTQELANSKIELEAKLNTLHANIGSLDEKEQSDMFNLDETIGKLQELKTQFPDDELRGDIQKLASKKVQTDLDFVEKMFSIQTEILQKATETTEQEMDEIVKKVTEDIGYIKNVEISNDITLEKLQKLVTQAENVKK